MDSAGWKKYLDEMDREEYDRMVEDLEEKYYHEMSPEEFLDVFEKVFPRPTDNRNIFEIAFCPPGVDKMDPQIWEKYYNQLNESEGFDIFDFPGCCLKASIVPMYYDMRLAKTDQCLIDCSILALDLYNHREDTSYTFDQVVKANCELAAGATYFITFLAVHPQNYLKYFQAEVVTPTRGPREHDQIVSETD